MNEKGLSDYLPQMARGCCVEYAIQDTFGGWAYSTFDHLLILSSVELVSPEKLQLQTNGLEWFFINTIESSILVISFLIFGYS